MQKLGIGLQVVESVLGHVGGSRAGVVGIYQRHTYDAEKRAALEAQGAHVMGLVDDGTPGKVLPCGGTREKSYPCRLYLTYGSIQDLP